MKIHIDLIEEFMENINYVIIGMGDTVSEEMLDLQRKAEDLYLEFDYE